MARPNQFSFIPTNGLSAGCSIASRYNGGVQTDYAMSNAPPYTHAAPSNFITPNSQCCWGASVSGHFPKGENDWNEKRHDPLNQTSGQQSRHLPMFIPTASYFPNEPAPEHTLTLRDPRIDQRHPLRSRVTATKEFGESDFGQDANFADDTGKKIIACRDLAIGILSSWVYLKPNYRSLNLEQLYQEAFQALHPTTCSIILAKLNGAVENEYQELGLHDVKSGLFSFFYEYHGDQQASHLEKLHRHLEGTDIDEIDLQRLTWSIFVRRLETEPYWILGALSKALRDL